MIFQLSIINEKKGKKKDEGKRIKDERKESEARSQEPEEKEKSEPPCCVATQRVMAMMTLIFMMKVQERAAARSFYLPSPTCGRGAGGEGKKAGSKPCVCLKKYKD